VSQGLGLLGRELEALANCLGGTEVDDEGEDLHLGAAEQAQERVDLVDAANQLRPAEPGTSGVGAGLSPESRQPRWPRSPKMAKVALRVGMAVFGKKEARSDESRTA